MTLESFCSQVATYGCDEVCRDDSMLDFVRSSLEAGSSCGGTSVDELIRAWSRQRSAFQDR